MKFWKVFVVFLLFLVLSLSIHKKHVASFPHQIHAWAHCDHYAIAKGFQNNGFDIFKPETLNYNKQFENADSTAHKSLTTAIDFPINQYAVALTMTATGIDSPLIYRLYSLLLSCIGLSFLFLIAYHYNGNYLFSFLLVALLTFTPLYLDYQDGFLPTINALSFLYIGLYYVLTKKEQSKYLLIGLFFLLLSSLTRLPFSIFLIAYIGILFLNLIQKKEVKFRSLLTPILFILPVILYFIYNGYLRSKYGSVFLSSIRPSDSLSALIDLLLRIKTRWKEHYFTTFQYIIIGSTFIISVGNIFLKKCAIRFSFNENWIGLSFLGTAFYSLLMAKQFEAHDYYFLDTFYPIIVLITVIQISKLNFSKGIPIIQYLLLVALCFYTLKNSKITLEIRRTDHQESGYQINYESYLDSQVLLEKHNVLQTDKILVFAPYAPNMPLLLMNKTGYSVQNTALINIDRVLQWDFDWIVISNYYIFNDLLLNDPNISKKIEFVATNKKISLFKLRDKPLQKQISNFDFFKIDKNSVVLVDSSYQDWNHFIKSETDLEYGIITNDELYGPTFEITLNQLDLKQNFLYFSGDLIDSQNLENLNIIIDISNKENNIYYHNYSIESLISNDERNSFDLFCIMPKLSSHSTLKVYFYNPNNNSLLYKDLKVQLY